MESMKTIFAKEKSEYAILLWDNVINFKLTKEQRENNWQRMMEIEDKVVNQGDKIITIITTENTNKINYAPPMSMKNIKNV